MSIWIDDRLIIIKQTDGGHIDYSTDKPGYKPVFKNERKPVIPTYYSRYRNVFSTAYWMIVKSAVNWSFTAATPCCLWRGGGDGCDH